MSELVLEKSDESDLPIGWKWARINDITKRVVDGTHHTPAYVESGIPFLSVKDIRENMIFFDNCRFISEKDHIELTKRCNPEFNDILITKSGTIGRTAVVKTDRPFSLFVSVALLKIFDKYLNSNFVNYAIQNYINHLDISQEIKGGVIKNFHLEDLRLVNIQIPPLNEQKRIVAKIEELTSELHYAIEILTELKLKLKQYRQSLLNDAVFGRLSEHWRTKHEAEIRRTSLEDLMENRRKKWESSQMKKFQLENNVPKNNNWKTKYREPLTPRSNLPILPDLWNWVTLDQITWHVRDGPHYSPKYADDGIPFITGGNVRPFGIDFVNAKRISPALHEELSKRCKPEKNDVLYTKGGTTGIARVNTYDFEFNVWVHVAVLKLVDQLNPFYIQWALNSPFCYLQSQNFTHGVGNQDLGLTRMIKIVLSLPPLTEQNIIVDLIEKNFSEMDELDKIISLNLSFMDQLNNSILKQAFEGKLIPQDPNDEPAEILLQKIKQEKQKIISQSQKPRKKK